MAKSSDDFDVLTFFIYVMAFLTAIVAGFAGWNYKNVGEASRKVKTELSNLRQLETLAKDPQLQKWLARERETTEVGGGRASDFEAMLVNQVQRMGLSDNYKGKQQQQRPIRGIGTEITFRLTFEELRVEELVKYLAYLEDNWPGARVTKIGQLEYREKQDAWNAYVDVTIFIAEAES